MKITHLPKNAFRGMNIQFIQLQGNDIEYIEEEAFDGRVIYDL